MAKVFTLFVQENLDFCWMKSPVRGMNSADLTMFEIQGCDWIYQICRKMGVRLVSQSSDHCPLPTVEG